MRASVSWGCTEMTQNLFARESAWRQFHASDTYRVSSDGDIMLEFDRPLWNIWATRTCREHLLLGVSFPPSSGGKRSRPLLFWVVLGVWCSVRLFQLSWKKLLGNRNGHRPRPSVREMESWVRIPDIQPHLRIIYSFSLWCAARDASGRRAEMDTSMHVWKSTCLRRTEVTRRKVCVGHLLLVFVSAGMQQCSCH